jgi:hypothetical protein
MLWILGCSWLAKITIGGKQKKPSEIKLTVLPTNLINPRYENQTNV